MTATTDDTNAVVIAGIDQFLVLISAVRATNPRDPMAALVDQLLEMRASVGAGVR